MNAATALGVEVFDSLAARSLLAALAALTLGAVALAADRRWPRLAQGLWALVLLRLVLPPALEAPWGWSLETALAEAWGAVLAGFGPPAAAEAAGGLAGLGPAVAGAELGGMPDPARVGAAVLAGLWLFGVALLGSFYARRWLGWQRVVSRGRVLPAGVALDLAERWRGRLGIRRKVRYRVSTEVAVPFTTGSLAPVVVLPAALVRGNASILETALAHELAHVVRWDCLTLGAQNLVQLLFFFHPAVWIAGRRLSRLRERLCDERALRTGAISGRSYGAGLLAVLRMNLDSAAARPEPALGLVGQSADRRRIAMRLEDILHRRTSTRARRAGAWLAAVLCGALLLPFAAGAASGPDGRGEADPDAVSTAPRAQLLAPLPVRADAVTSPYGERRDPITGAERQFHRGVDLKAAHGTEVRAPAAGRVLEATVGEGDAEGWGKVIALAHAGGVETYFAHLGEVLVAVGDEVAAGALIARVGSTGASTGPHLHFEVRENGDAVDPATRVEGIGLH